MHADDTEQTIEQRWPYNLLIASGICLPNKFL